MSALFRRADLFAADEALLFATSTANLSSPLF